METEIWKDIIGYEGYYQISNLGNVKGIDRKLNSGFGSFRMHKGKILKSTHSKYGYLMINLNKNRKLKTQLIHRLVAIAFIPNPENKKTVNHKNGIKTDNRVENLEWNSYKENINHGWKNNLYSKNIGDNASSNKITEKEAIEIKNSNLPQKELASKYNIHQSTVSDIKTGRRWKHI